MMNYHLFFVWICLISTSFLKAVLLHTEFWVGRIPYLPPHFIVFCLIFFEKSAVSFVAFSMWVFLSLLVRSFWFLVNITLRYLGVVFFCQCCVGFVELPGFVEKSQPLSLQVLFLFYYLSFSLSNFLFSYL